MQDPVKKQLKLVNYAGVGVVALLLAGATTFGILPMYQKGNASIKAKADLQATLLRFQGLREVISQVEKERGEFETKLKEMEQRLPASVEVSKFNSELTEVAKSTNIRIESMPKPEETREFEGYKYMPMTIVGTGDWDSCYKFLTGIRAMSRMTRLDLVSLQVVSEEGKVPADKPLCQITVKFSTFYMER